MSVLKLGKYHFCIMSERTLRYRTDNIQAKCSKSQKREREAQSAEMDMCVSWYLKWNSLWRYTMLPSYNFIKWMFSMIVTVRLWHHSKYRTNQTESIYIYFPKEIQNDHLNQSESTTTNPRWLPTIHGTTLGVHAKDQLIRIKNRLGVLQ
jgi:hypothetical protein